MAEEGVSKIREAKNFLTESVEEIQKVSFPTRRETTQAMIVTVIIISFISLYLFLADVVFSRVVGALLPG